MLAQAAGEFPCVRETFDEASEALGYDLWDLVSNGPEEQLTLTEFTQPSILTASVALHRCWILAGGAQHWPCAETKNACISTGKIAGDQSMPATLLLSQ